MIVATDKTTNYQCNVTTKQRNNEEERNNKATKEQSNITT